MTKEYFKWLFEFRDFKDVFVRSDGKIDATKCNVRYTGIKLISAGNERSGCINYNFIITNKEILA